MAVTRAKALLIIVGDPLVLSLDPLWRSFLSQVHLGGGWTGSEIPWDPNAPVDGSIDYAAEIRQEAQFDMDEFTKRVETVVLDDVTRDDN